MNEESLKLENQLCFPLYACARMIIKKYTPLLADIGLTYTQYITMMVLWDKKSISAKDLGEALYLDSGTLTPLLKKLERSGLARRERSTLDERNLIVTITPKGEALKEKAALVPMQMKNCVDLESEDARELYALLYKLLREPDRGTGLLSGF
jgi:DNA-binding MarR family transcriptional regulator